jgi:serine/threonine protein kinase
MLMMENNLDESFGAVSHNIIDKYVVTNQLLGSGTYAKVFKGHLKDNPSHMIAVKEIAILSKANNKKFHTNLNREIEILQKLNHPAIIKIYDVVRYPEKLFIFLELCENGDLKQCLATKKFFSEQEVLSYMNQIVSAFKELYANNVIHRDLKPANILLSNNGQNVKISDFGFAREIHIGMNEAADFTRYGSPLYMSPQILSGQPFSSKCDVWSLGTMIYQMLQGKTPWYGTTPQELQKNILTKPLTLPDKCSKEMSTLIGRMLMISEKDRISWEEIFKNELFVKDPFMVKKDSHVLQQNTAGPAPKKSCCCTIF